MRVYNDKEFEIVNIHIGLRIKQARLKIGKSQLEFASSIDRDNTAIGRIERASHYTSWNMILYVCQNLNINLQEVFILKSKDELYNLIDQCYELDAKLTYAKVQYYSNLKARLENLYS